MPTGMMGLSRLGSLRPLAFVAALLPTALLCWGADPVVLRAGPDPLSSDGQFLPVDEAFALAVRLDEGRVVARWTIAEGYYLYRHAFALRAGDDDRLGPVEVPAGELIEDEYFGLTEVYRNSVEINAKLSEPAVPPAVVHVGYRGCAEAGLCYPPQLRTIPIDGLVDAPEPARSSGATLP